MKPFAHRKKMGGVKETKTRNFPRKLGHKMDKIRYKNRPKKRWIFSIHTSSRISKANFAIKWAA
jgi:hypothetical protein